MKKIISTDRAPAAIGPYNQAIETDSLVFVSGQIPLGKDGSIIDKPVSELTSIVLTNIEHILKASGLTREHIVKTTIFLADIDDFSELNVAYGEFFEGTEYPARSTVAVKELPKGSPIEIEAIVVIILGLAFSFLGFCPKSPI